MFGILDVARLPGCRESGGPGRRGLWARSPEVLGPGPQGLGPGPPGAGQTSQMSIFRKPPRGRRGCRLKRLLWRWGPGEKRSRDTPPNPPPLPPPRPHIFGAVREKGRGFSPSPPSVTIQHAPQGRRIGLSGCPLNPKPLTLNPRL